MPDGPLSGIRVVEFAGFIAGPGVGMVLTELGADVIKVEPLAGDSARSIGPYGDAIWRASNRGKRSIALDLADPRGVEAALEIIKGSDVVVQNLRPGAMSRLGLSAADLGGRFPGLIYVSITGYRSTGPNAARLGFDIAAQAESGMMSLTGETGGDPLRIGYPIVDIVTGHFGAEAVLAAIIGRSRTGAGCAIELPMFDVAVHLQGIPLSTFLDLGEEPVRTGNGQPFNAPSADVLHTADGRIVISAYPEAHWRRLCRAIGRPDLAEDPRFAANADRVKNRPAMLDELSSYFAKVDTATAGDVLAGHAIVFGAVRSYPDLVGSSEFTAGDFVIEAHEADGTPVPAIRAPYRIPGSGQPASSLPAIGEHGREILRETGMSPDAIAVLEEAGVLGKRA